MKEEGKSYALYFYKLLCRILASEMVASEVMWEGAIASSYTCLRMRQLTLI